MYDVRKGEQRQFMRVKCSISAEFQLPAQQDFWFSAEVLDLSIIGVRLRFKPRQRGRVLVDEDIQWQDTLFRFSSDKETFILTGHFLMVYLRENEHFTAGVEFTDVTPEQQFRLVSLYAEYRREMARAAR